MTKRENQEEEKENLINFKKEIISFKIEEMIEKKKIIQVMNL